MEAIAWIALSVLSVFIAKAVYRQQCSRLLAFTSGLLLFFGVSFLAWAFHNRTATYIICMCNIRNFVIRVWLFLASGYECDRWENEV